MTARDRESLARPAGFPTPSGSPRLVANLGRLLRLSLQDFGWHFLPLQTQEGGGAIEYFPARRRNAPVRAPLSYRLESLAGFGERQ